MCHSGGPLCKVMFIFYYNTVFRVTLFEFLTMIFTPQPHKFFKNCPKTAFLTVFSKICLRRTKFSQSRGKTVLWESSKNQFGRPKKKKSRQNFGKFFENPPPLEKILDPPLHTMLLNIFLH